MSHLKRKNKIEEVGDGEDNASESSIVDIDFEFFDPDPVVDYHALKRLLGQLFQADGEALHLQQLTELILSQPLLGSTVKTDGKESDPLAFLSVINLHVHAAHGSISSLIDYALRKSRPDHIFHAKLQELVGPEGIKSKKHVAIVLSERLINMPVQVAPPMYKMLRDEITWANEEDEPYQFTHYLFITRTYRLTPEEVLNLEEPNKGSRPSKRQKAKGEAHPRNVGGLSTYSFHPEDELIMKFAMHSIDYELDSFQNREKDSFGLHNAGRLILVGIEQWDQLVDAMIKDYSNPN